MLSWFWICATFLLLPSWSMLSLLRNYRLARSTQLQVIISPVSCFDPLWMLTRRYLQPLLSRLPFTGFIQCSYLGWTWHDKGHLHNLLGPAFIIATPSGNQLIVADPSACDEILRRRNDWVKNPLFNGPLDIFGPSVGTSAGNAWQRQRKITAAAFNERNNSLVWSESVKQASQMLQKWTNAGNDGVTSVAEDSNLLALHVLSSAGFGLAYDFDTAYSQLAEGHTMSYRDALGTVMENIFITFAITSLPVLPRSWLPQQISRVRTAIYEFKCYMTEMLKAERSAKERGEGSKANLMASLIHASEDDGKASLTDNELFGNLFIYNVGGHETNAVTLSYAVALLTCFPQWQDWVQEELDQVFGDNKDMKDVQYEEAFPRLQRCLALMHETLRLYAPLNAVPRYTGDSPQVLRLPDSTHIIPPKTVVFINNAATQMSPSHWGPDALLWRPDRWIHLSPSGETVTPPSTAPQTAYLAWISGPRICPGKKFSQVEFVAVVAQLFSRYRVLPVLEDGEGLEEARRRLMKVVNDSDTSLAMHMNHPERLRVRWERRVAAKREG